jgi:hypothetical protein
MIADITPKGINNAFNKLIKKLTITADIHATPEARGWQGMPVVVPRYGRRDRKSQAGIPQLFSRSYEPQVEKL